MSPKEKGIRGGTRIPIELPVQIRWRSRAGDQRFAYGKTGSMSGNGLLIIAPLRLRHDMPIAITVSLPAEVTNVPVQLLCDGRVVRRQRVGTSSGVGVVIDDYRLAAVGRSGQIAAK